MLTPSDNQIAHEAAVNSDIRGNTDMAGTPSSVDEVVVIKEVEDDDEDDPIRVIGSQECATDGGPAVAIDDVADTEESDDATDEPEVLGSVYEDGVRRSSRHKF